MKENDTHTELKNRIADLERQVAALETSARLCPSEREYRDLYEHAPIGIFRTNSQGRALAINIAMARMLGFDTSEAAIAYYTDLGRQLYVDRDVREVFLHRLRKDGHVENFEYQARTFDGRHIWLNMNARLVEGRQDGQFVMEGFATDISPRKETEEVLNRRTEIMAAILDNVPVMIVFLDHEGRFLLVNRHWRDTFGWSLQDAQETDVWAAIYPDPACRDAVAAFIAAADGKWGEFQTHTRDGRILETQWANLRLQDGSTVGIGLDITERKRADRALRDAMLRQDEAVRAGHVGLWDWDPESNEVHYSTEWKRQIGYDDHEIENDVAEWSGRVHPDDRDRTFAIMRDCVAEGSSRQTEFRLRHKDGSYRWIFARASTLRDDSGNTARMFGSNIDITERKNAEEVLRGIIQVQRELQTQLANAVEIANLGHWEYDVGEDLFRFNDQFYRLFKTTARDVGGYTLSAAEYAERFVHQADRSRVEKEIRNAIATTDPHFRRRLEHRIIYADGTVGHISVLFYIQKDSLGNTVRTYGVNQDITERKHIEARLLQAQKMESIGNLAGGIAHDFNNILFPIMGLSEMLMEDLPAGSLEQDSAREIHEAGKRGSELVKQILTFSRQSEQQVMPLHVQKVLKEALHLCTATIPSDIGIVSDIQQDCGAVMGNPTQIHQIAMNLMTNAYHAIEPHHGEIRVTLQEVSLEEAPWPGSTLEAGRYTLLSVADTGCGIGPADMGRIFEPYFTTKPQGKGTGLGLAVVYGIVKEHRGDIRVQSEQGIGTTFEVYLPLLERLSEEKADVPLPVHPTGDERILLVDDEEAVVRLERRMLESLGYRISARIDSREALEAFRSEPERFDLVVTDMTMPRMTGDQLAREMLAIRPGFPIILCTGFSERITPEKARRLGIKGFLLKPVVKSQLAAAVRNVLDETFSD